VERFNGSYVLVNFFKYLLYFKWLNYVIIVQLKNEGMQNSWENCKQGLKTASSFHVWESQTVPLCRGLPYSQASLHSSRDATVHRSIHFDDSVPSVDQTNKQHWQTRSIARPLCDSWASCYYRALWQCIPSPTPLAAKRAL